MSVPGKIPHHERRARQRDIPLPPLKDAKAEAARQKRTSVKARAQRAYKTGGDAALRKLEAEIMLRTRPLGPDGKPVRIRRRTRNKELHGWAHPSTYEARMAKLAASRTYLFSADWVENGRRACKGVNREGKPCRAAAVRKSDFCRSHGGRVEVERRNRELYLNPILPRQGEEIRQAIRRLVDKGRWPVDLERNPLVQRVSQAARTREGLLELWPDVDTWPVARRALLRENLWKLLLAFAVAHEDWQHRNDPGPWQACVHRAGLMGIRAG